MGAALARGTAELSSDFLWEAAVALLFSRRTLNALGTNRVISALGLVICGLAVTVAVAWVAESSWVGHLKSQGSARELVGKAQGGRSQGEVPKLGASCQDKIYLH